MAGAYAGLVQSPLRQIVERVKSVMQIQENLLGKSRYRWSGECFLDLLRSGSQSSSAHSSSRILNGGLWQGMSSVLLREIPQFAVYYPTYAVSKCKLWNSCLILITIRTWVGSFDSLLHPIIRPHECFLRSATSWRWADLIYQRLVFLNGLF